MPLAAALFAILLMSAGNVSFLYVLYRISASSTHSSPAGNSLFKQTRASQVALNYKTDLMSIMSEDLWGQIIPANGGVIKTTEGQSIVAMFQQLRCLDEVRVAYLAVHGKAAPERIPNTGVAEVCLGQLWQIIQCNADITLDPTVLLERNGTLLPGSTGANVDHRCNDWTRVRDVVESK
ncbi:hypothetical protein NMY22_g14170 [Coprinellus aureogranulatus]|nr:hypothetical protein NMY22_g14170 [Coprinellus aureogranulatus]